MKAHFFVALLAVAMPYEAIGQQKTGTVIVYYVTPHEVVIAADSRLTAELSPGRAILADDACKILTFDNKYIFAAAGYAGRGAGPTAWSVADLTKAIYGQGGIFRTADFANRWTKNMLAVLNRDSAVSAPPVKQGGLVLGALFVGIEKQRIEVKYRAIGRNYREIAGIISPEISLTSALVIAPDGEINAIGDADVFSEFKANKTARAREWHGRIDALSTENKVVAIAELVRENELGGGVGGKIDAARITPSRGIQWLAVKPGCSQ